MSFSKVHSAQVVALRVHIVDIEIDLSRGLHAFTIVGLPDKATAEAKDRFSAAIKNSGFTSPKQKNQKVVVSLAPADMKKAGPHFDLGIAIGYLLAAKDLSFDPRDILFIGELSLDGTIRKASSVLPLVHEAKLRGFKKVFVPKENAREAALMEGVSVYGASTLIDVIVHLKKEILLAKNPETSLGDFTTSHCYEIDFKDVMRQERAKRALEIAAAGGHSILMKGPPGTGKTMLAKALRSILPPLSLEEMIEVNTIHATAKEISGLNTLPPFRSPHHTSSYASIIGGTSLLFAGEITLSHRGVLFLDELAEFDRRVIESLREPLEEKKITVSRSKGKATLPSNFIFIAAMNPCPCGNYGTERKPCSCARGSILKYQQKVSDPIKDRIDLLIDLKYEPVLSQTKKITAGSDRGAIESSQVIRERVIRARAVQKMRFKKLGLPNIQTNSDLPVSRINDLHFITQEQEKMLTAACERHRLSTRSAHRIIKIARTIADLGESEAIRDEHLIEALLYKKSPVEI